MRLLAKHEACANCSQYFAATFDGCGFVRVQDGRITRAPSAFGSPEANEIILPAGYGRSWGLLYSSPYFYLSTTRAPGSSPSDYRILMIDPVDNGFVVDEFAIGYGGALAISIDGNLWHADTYRPGSREFTASKIYKRSRATGERLDEITLRQPLPLWSMAAGCGRLWASLRWNTTVKVVQLDTADGSVVASVDLDSSTDLAVTFDGVHLWALGAQWVYQLAP